MTLPAPVNVSVRHAICARDVVPPSADARGDRAADVVASGWVRDLLARAGRAAAYRVLAHTADGQPVPVRAAVDIVFDEHLSSVEITDTEPGITDIHVVEQAVRDGGLIWLLEAHRVADAATAAEVPPEDRDAVLHGWEVAVALGVRLSAVDPVATLRSLAAGVPVEWLPRLALAGVDLPAAGDLLRTYDGEGLATVLDRTALGQG